MRTSVDNASQPLALALVTICLRHAERQAEEQWKTETDYLITHSFALRLNTEVS